MLIDDTQRFGGRLELVASRCYSGPSNDFSSANSRAVRRKAKSGGNFLRLRDTCSFKRLVTTPKTCA